MINVEDISMKKPLIDSFSLIKNKLKNTIFIDEIEIDPKNKILKEAYSFQNKIEEGIKRNDQEYKVSGKLDKCLFALKSYEKKFTFKKTTIGFYLVNFLVGSERPYNYHNMSEDEVNTILKNKKITPQQLKNVFDGYVNSLNISYDDVYIDEVINSWGHSAEENIHHEIYYYQLNLNNSENIYYFINADMKNRHAHSIGYSKSIADFNNYIENNYFIYEIENNVRGNFKFNLLNN